MYIYVQSSDWDNWWTVHAPVHAILDVVMCTHDGHHEAFNAGQKNLLSTKVESNVPRRSQAKEMKFAVPAMDALWMRTMLAWFSIFLVHFGWIGFIPHCAYFFQCNPRIRHPGQSKDCLLIHALCTSLGTVWGLPCKAQIQGLCRTISRLSQSLLCTYHIILLTRVAISSYSLHCTGYSTYKCTFTVKW